MSTRKKQRKPVKRNTSSKKKSSNTLLLSVKQNFNLFFIWALVVVNAVLISSFVHKLVTPEQTPTVTSDFTIDDPIKVQILNGCGVSGIANEFAELLERKKYKVVDVGNAPNWDYEKTVIINRERKERKYIDKFQDLIGVSSEMVYRIQNDEVESDITLIIGSDYESLKSYRALQ